MIIISTFLERVALEVLYMDGIPATGNIDNLGDKLQWKSLLERQASEVSRNVLNSMLKIIKAKDIELYGHSERVAWYVLLIGRYMNFDDERLYALECAALLHDIGKISIRDRILYKPGRLNEDEFDEMKNHPSIGAEIVSELGFPDTVPEAILQHHEQADGSGYPSELKDGDILLEAKILSVADSFDALTSDRVYRSELSWEEAFKILEQESGRHYDASIVNILWNLLNE